MTDGSSDESSYEERLDGAIRDLLLRAQTLGAAEELDRPHSVLELDPETKHLQVVGPFPTAAAAATALEEMREYDRRTGQEPWLQFTVVRSFTPAESGLLDDGRRKPWTKPSE